jgi:NAD(P)-dependent dehydrogenase (short-subunit alcohol dehydrogenase family)
MTNKAWLWGAAGVGAALVAREVVRRSRRIDLEGRVVVITGGSTGLGLMSARQAAREGARLVIAARDEPTLRAAAETLRGEGAVEVLAVPTDVSDQAQAKKLIDEALGRFGCIDVLVNNAGVMQFGPHEAMTLDDFRDAMATNFWGAVHCTEAVMPSMRQQGFGRVANVVSIGGLVASPHLVSYTCSKFALTGYTRSVRIEAARHGVLVTGVYPMTIRTGGHTHAWMKGNVEAEYRMFAAVDTIPGLSVAGERCAELLWKAVRNGDAEVHVGISTFVLSRLQALAPAVSAEAMTLVNGAFPTADGGGERAVQGRDVPGKVAGWFNRLVPAEGRPDGHAEG